MIRGGAGRGTLTFVISSLADGILPRLPVMSGVLFVVVFVVAPLPGRGPGIGQRRDPWRTFRFRGRTLVMSRAGWRCEAASFLAWGRCRQPAVEADHIYPWSRTARRHSATDKRSAALTIGASPTFALRGGTSAAWKPALDLLPSQ